MAAWSRRSASRILNPRAGTGAQTASGSSASSDKHASAQASGAGATSREQNQSAQTGSGATSQEQRRY